MRKIEREQVYINLETKYSVNLNTHVYIKDLGEVYCNNDGIKKKVEDIRVYNVKILKNTITYLVLKLQLRY